MHLAASVSLLAGCTASDQPDVGAIRGTLAVYIEQDGQGTTHYALRVGGDDGNELRLVFAQPPELPPQAAVDVWGQVYPDRIVVDRFKVVAAGDTDVAVARSALIDAPPFPTRTLAYVLVDIGGGLGTYTPAQAAIDVFGTGAADGSVKQYTLETSYGRRDVGGGVVTGLSYAMNGCSDYSNLANSLRSQVNAALGFTPQHYMWQLLTRNSSCFWAALSAVGSPSNPARDTWYNASSSCVVLASGPGHNVGMKNSSSLRCAGASFANDPSTCTHSEYGDSYDVMGGGCRHLNALHKGHQGYFGGCNRVRVNATGTFTLLPVEVECNGIQVLQIPMPVQGRTISVSGGGGGPSPQPVSFYYLELRTRVGFDQPMVNAPTVLVHVGPEYVPLTQLGKPTWLLDMVPSTVGSNSFDGMPVGVTFTDPAGGVSFVVQSASATGATVNVTIANGSGAPTCFDGGSITPPGPASCGP